MKYHLGAVVATEAKHATFKQGKIYRLRIVVVKGTFRFLESLDDQFMNSNLK